MSSALRMLSGSGQRAPSAQGATQFEALSEAQKAAIARPSTPETRHFVSHSAPSATVSTKAQRTIHPANDGPIGFLSGTAPNPEFEIVVKPDPAFAEVAESANDWKPKTLELATATEERGNRYIDDEPEEDAPAIKPQITENEFVEFWAIGAWDALTKFSGMFGLDLHELKTEPGEEDDGRAAAACLYKLALKYPNYLGWMLSPSTLIGGDLAIVAFFFGGKMLATMKGLKQRGDARKALEASSEPKPPKPNKRDRRTAKAKEKHFKRATTAPIIIEGNL